MEKKHQVTIWRVNIYWYMRTLQHKFTILSMFSGNFWRWLVCIMVTLNFNLIHISSIHSFELCEQLQCDSSYISNLWTLFHIFNTFKFPGGCDILKTYKFFWTQFTNKFLVHLLMNLILRDFWQKIQILSGPIFWYISLNCASEFYGISLYWTNSFSKCWFWY